MSALKDLGKIISDLPNSSKVLLGLVSATLTILGFGMVHKWVTNY